MRTPLLLASLILFAACAGSSGDSASALPGHGAVAIDVIPNPIVARHVSGDTYDFPFEVIVQETGGRPINITRVSITVVGPGGLSLGSESWDADQIRSMGHSTSLGANSEVRLRFSPRKSVPDERIFGSIAADLRVEAVDDSGQATAATKRVTARRG